MTYNEFVEKLASECKTTAMYHEDGFSMRLFNETYLVGFHSAWDDRLTIMAMSYEVYDQMIEDMKIDDHKLPLPVFAYTYGYGSRLCVFMTYDHIDANEMFIDIDECDDCEYENLYAFYDEFMKYAYYDETYQAYCFEGEEGWDDCGDPTRPIGYSIQRGWGDNRLMISEDYFATRHALIKMSNEHASRHDLAFTIYPIDMVQDPSAKLCYFLRDFKN
jgi:hypothetical protein